MALLLQSLGQDNSRPGLKTDDWRPAAYRGPKMPPLESVPATPTEGAQLPLWPWGLALPPEYQPVSQYPWSPCTQKGVLFFLYGECCTL